MDLMVRLDGDKEKGQLPHTARIASLFILSLSVQFFFFFFFFNSFNAHLSVLVHVHTYA